MDRRITRSELFARADELAITLPQTPTPKGDYRPAVVHHGLIYTSGMGTMLDGVRHHVGYVGAEVTLGDAQDAAVISALNALMAAVDAAGGVENIDRIIRMTGFVRSAPLFTQQSAVLDKASQVLVQLLGDRGVHARSAIGVAELPFGIPVEIELIVACNEKP